MESKYMQAVIFWFFAIYIATECFICFYRMHKGDKFCRLAKYFFALATALLALALHYLLNAHVAVWFWLVPNCAVALFLWPTTYARLTGQYKNRIGDR
jgi:fatty acid desaturase